MSEMQSPLARLVLFMIFLSVAGALIAGMHYLVIDKPSQDAVEQPLNDLHSYCIKACRVHLYSCEHMALNPKDVDKALCESTYQACLNGC